MVPRIRWPVAPYSISEVNSIASSSHFLFPSLSTPPPPLGGIGILQAAPQACNLSWPCWCRSAGVKQVERIGTDGLGMAHRSPWADQGRKWSCTTLGRAPKPCSPVCFNLPDNWQASPPRTAPWKLSGQCWHLAESSSLGRGSPLRLRPGACLSPPPTPSFALEDSASTLQVGRQLGLVPLKLPGVAVPGGCRRHPGRESGLRPWL